MPRHLQRQRPWPAATCASRPRWGVAPAGLPTAGSPREARNRRAPCPRTLEDHRSRPAPLPLSRGCGRPEYPPGIRPCSSSSPSRSRTTARTAPAPAATVDCLTRTLRYVACTRAVRHYPFGMRSDLAVVGPPASHPAHGSCEPWVTLGPHSGHERPDRSGQTPVATGPASSQLSGPTGVAAGSSELMTRGSGLVATIS